MVFIDTGRFDADSIVRAMADDGVLVGGFSPTRIRAVTSKEVDRAGIDRAIESFARAVGVGPAVAVAG